MKAAWVLATALGVMACSGDADETTDPTGGDPQGAGGPGSAGAGGAAAQEEAAAPGSGSGGVPPDLLTLADDLGEGGSAGTPQEPPMQTPFPEAPSCDQHSSAECQGGSCCQRQLVTTAQPLRLDAFREAALTSFEMDKYEATVSRFRTFADSYESWRAAGNPAAGAGQSPGAVGSGWLKETTWEGALPASRAELAVNLSCNESRQTWTSQPGYGDTRPINCVSWYEAFAFCVWDGGRLPTELEWQYAAAGGGEARPYPWGTDAIAKNRAVYGCLGAGSGETCSLDDILSVGSAPDGDGRFGHSDLVGSVFEWVVDWYAPFPEVLPKDYALVSSGTERLLRGGGWINTMLEVLSSTDRSTARPPTFRSPNTGVRCVRTVSSTEF